MHLESFKILQICLHLERLVRQQNRTLSPLEGTLRNTRVICGGFHTLYQVSLRRDVRSRPSVSERFNDMRAESGHQLRLGRFSIRSVIAALYEASPAFCCATCLIGAI